MKKMNSYWYLATPYSQYRDGLEAAFALAAKAAAVLVRAGVPVFSPIAHTHPVARFGNMDPLDHSIWLPADEPLMRAAHGLIVLTADGWQDSYGIGFEIEMFNSMNRPVHYMTPFVVPMEVYRDDAARVLAHEAV